MSEQPCTRDIATVMEHNVVRSHAPHDVNRRILPNYTARQKSFLHEAASSLTGEQSRNQIAAFVRKSATPLSFPRNFLRAWPSISNPRSSGLQRHTPMRGARSPKRALNPPIYRTHCMNSTDDHGHTGLRNGSVEPECHEGRPSSN